ncbi:MAG: carboxypeptidase regulatory-like domain-containing protein [Muribaculaceae bacterium]|nr:carboxypeptidase regulatory-like domain-containing protein [Muribaculaceae bacterium]
MKLRKLLATTAMAFLMGASANAQNPTVEDVRIYINPGHGSWTAGDRPMGTVKHGANNAYSDANNDTTNFFESNTNLQKGLALLEKLVSFGVPFDRTKNQTNDNPHRVGAALDMSQNIVMSHVKCGSWAPYLDYTTHKENPENDYYNRSLSEISAEVEFNDFDLFVSIHSNANTDGDNVNFPLFLYRGTDAQEGNAGSIAVSKACWSYLYNVGHQQWSAYKNGTNIRGDHSFYGSPGTAYYPITDPDYVFDETDNFSEFLPGADETVPDTVAYTGYLGVIKHGVPGFLAEGYFHTYQPARHRYMNWDVCHLEGVAYARGIADYFGWDKKETTGTIYGIVRDKHEHFSHDYYKANASTNDLLMPLNNVVVTLKKDGTEVATYTTDDEYNGAFVFNGVEPGNYTIECTHADYKPLEEPVAVTVEVGKNALPEVFLENIAYVPPAIVYVDYPDEIIEGGIKAASSYNVVEEYAAQAIEELEGTTIRRTQIKDDVMYILAIKEDNTPVLLVYDLVNKSVISQLGTTVCQGTRLALSDIQLTADGVLVGCAKGKNHYSSTQSSEDGEERGKVYFYKWENDENGVATGEAVEWFYTQKTGNFYRALVGNSFYYQGTIEKGSVVVTAETTGSSTQIWNIVISIIDGAVAGDAFARPDMHSSTEYETDYTWNLSPLDENYYVVSGTGKLPMEIILSDSETTNTVLAEGLLNKPFAKVEFFKYAGASFMVAADEVDGKAVVKLINVTEGFDKAKLVDVVVTEATDLGTLANASVNGRTIVERDAEGTLTDSWIELFLVNNGAITKLTTKSVEQPIVRGEYAYNLAMTETDGVYTLTFDVTGDDATDANIILTNKETGEETIVPVGVVNKGTNTQTIDGAEIAEGTYSWAVEVNGKAIATANRIHVDNTIIKGNNRGGVAIDNDPESDNYGKVYVTGGNSMGIQVVNQNLVSEGRYLTDKFNSGNSSSPFRCATSEGKVYISDWSDGYSGIWVFDPAKTDEVTNIFDESTRQPDGEFKNADEVITGGGTTGVSLIGNGEDRKMFMFCEDYPSANGQTPVGYDLGAADSWDKAPTYIYDNFKGYLANTNVEVRAYEEGIFWSQVRGSGNNSAGVPGFLFADYDGNVLFNSGESLKELDGCNGAGLSLNKDKTLFACANGNANVNIYEFEFVDGIPTFNFLYEVTISGATEVNEICFDAANNMYVYGRTVGLAVYSLPQETPKAVTPAKADLTITGTNTSIAIEDVEIEDANAPVEYYNLQGVKVANPEKGIFIKKQGNRTTKVVL